MTNAGKSVKKYYYRAFGLRIASDLYLSELTPYEGNSYDVAITYGIVPEGIDEVIWDISYIKLAKNELLLHIEGIADYFVAHGKDIVVQPVVGAEEAEVKLYLFGTCLGTLMLQKGILPIHGSSVIVDGQCVIFTGVSGAGKSTISAALRKMGYPFLSDDVSVVMLDQDGIPWVHPGFPQQKLCQDTIRTLGDDPQHLTMVQADIIKYYQPVTSGFQSSASRLHMICELVPEERTDVSLHKLQGSEKLKMLIHNIYRSEFLSFIGINPEFFKQCITVATKTTLYTLKRPKGVFSLEEQISRIKNELDLEHILI